MGHWGAGILGNDTSEAIYEEYSDLLAGGKSCAAATRAVRAGHALEFTDPQITTDAWVAVALAQWEFGLLTPEVFRRVSYLAKRGPGSLWQEAGVAASNQRQRVLDGFIAKLRTPPRRPRKPKGNQQPKRRAAAFEGGDALAVRLSDGMWGAALVTGRSDDQVISKRASKWDVTLNVVAQLEYRSKAKPTPDDFKARKWLRLTHSGWGGLRAVWNIDARGFKTRKARFEVVGRLPLRKSDPATTDFFSDWDFAEQAVLEHRHRSKR